MKLRVSKIGSIDQPIHPNSDYGNSYDFFQGHGEIPTVGQEFSLIPDSIFKPGIRTTCVTKVTDTVFYTLNSIYEYKIIDDDDEIEN